MIGVSATFVVDVRFWALTPAINLNFHSFSFEIEWLCFGLYLDAGRGR